jgi:hypothetical protein
LKDLNENKENILATTTKPKANSTAAHLAAVRDKKGRDLSPKWVDTESMSADVFMKHFRLSMDWYRLESSGRELKPKVINWMSQNGYTKDQIAQFKKTKDNRCGVTVGAIASNLLRGMPDSRPDFNEGRSCSEWLKAAISKIMAEGKDDVDEEELENSVEEKPAAGQPTIQERVREASMRMTEEIEDAIELFQEDPDAFDPKAFKLVNLLRGKQAKAAHARIIKDFYSKNHAELVEASTSKDEQLKEAYSHLSKVQMKKIIAFYNEVLTACDMLMQEAKLNKKPRAKKAVSKDKLVEKLKYAKTDEKLKLVSINPVDIIGSKELWVYNSKSRKLGKYVASEFNDLGIKGTSITGFDEFKSVQKTLRKPEEQLKEFKAAGKVALRKFLDDIKSVDIKLNGRINEEVVLLKVS